MSHGDDDAPDDITFSIRGRDIASVFPKEFHFITGCSNFETLGFNAQFKEFLYLFYQHRIAQNPERYTPGQPKGVREDVHEVLAFIENEVQARVRVWGRLHDHKVQRGALSSSNWQETDFRDITANDGLLKRKLEAPMRTALNKALTASGTQG